MSQWTRQTPTNPGWYWYTVIDRDGAVCQEPRLVQIVVDLEDEHDVILAVRIEDEGYEMRKRNLDSFVRDYLKTFLWQPVEIPAIPVERSVAA